MIQLQLEFIDFSKCPHCEERISHVKKECRHTSGEWNEYVTFVCGAEYHYSPNFKRVLLKLMCPDDPEMKVINRYMNRAYTAGCTGLSRAFKNVSVPREANKETRRLLQECLNTVYAEAVNDLINSLHKNMKRNTHFTTRRIL